MPFLMSGTRPGVPGRSEATVALYPGPGCGILSVMGMEAPEQDSARRVTTPAGDPAWQVSRYADVRALLTDPRLGMSHPDPARASRLSQSPLFGGPRGGDPEAERENHSRMRRALSRTFAVRRMEALRPRIQAMADRLLAEMAEHGPPADLHEALSFPLPVLVICELLGVPFEDRDQFSVWSDEAAHLTDRARATAGLRRLHDYMRRLTEQRRREPAEDVISDLIEARDERGELTEDEIVAIAAGLLFAGHETTVAAIDKGALLLLTTPDQREALQREPELVAGAVEEILRSPAPLLEVGRRGPGGLPRYASAAIDVGGAAVEPGDLLMLDVRGANRDPTRWADPDRFDVGRADNPHLAFGHGPHFCLGAPLARIELQVVFGTLFRAFPTLRLAVPVEDLRPRTGLLTGGFEELPVTWTA
jgi:cytochrome P450